MENLLVPKMDSVLWRNISDKGKVVDARIQKVVAKFLPGMSAVIQQFALLHKHKKKIKKNPLLKEICKAHYRCGSFNIAHCVCFLPAKKGLYQA